MHLRRGELGSAKDANTDGAEQKGHSPPAAPSACAPSGLWVQTTDQETDGVNAGMAAVGMARVAGGPYLVVNRHLRVGVALVEGFDLADVLLLWELHHPEHDRHLCWKLGELQLATRRRCRGRRHGKKGEYAGRLPRKKFREESEKKIQNNCS